MALDERWFYAIWTDAEADVRHGDRNGHSWQAGELTGVYPAEVAAEAIRQAHRHLEPGEYMVSAVRAYDKFAVLRHVYLSETVRERKALKITVLGDAREDDDTYYVNGDYTS